MSTLPSAVSFASFQSALSAYQAAQAATIAINSQWVACRQAEAAALAALMTAQSALIGSASASTQQIVS